MIIGNLITLGQSPKYYSGSYIVNGGPSITLSTSGRMMSNDIQILAVPSSGTNLAKDIVEGASIINDVYGEISKIGPSAFAGRGVLEPSNFKEFIFPAVKEIKRDAFANAYVQKVSFPNASYIATGAFNNCRYLESANFPKVEEMYSNAFNCCYSLSIASFDILSRILETTFRSCSALKEIYFPSVSLVSDSAFLSCKSITSLNMPLVEVIYSDAFSGCTSLSTVSCPALRTVGYNVFGNDTNLTSFYAPSLQYINTSAFAYCYSLSTLSFPSLKSIGSYAFRGCRLLQSLYLLSESVVRLYEANAFSSTPISNYREYTDGVYGSIYVPASLVSEYQSASNWSVYSARITAYVE